MTVALDARHLLAGNGHLVRDPASGHLVRGRYQLLTPDIYHYVQGSDDVFATALSNLNAASWNSATADTGYAKLQYAARTPYYRLDASTARYTLNGVGAGVKKIYFKILYTSSIATFGWWVGYTFSNSATPVGNGGAWLSGSTGNTTGTTQGEFSIVPTASNTTYLWIQTQVNPWSAPASYATHEVNYDTYDAPGLTARMIKLVL